MTVIINGTDNSASAPAVQGGNATQPAVNNIRIVTFNADQSKGWFEYNFVAVFR